MILFRHGDELRPRDCLLALLLLASTLPLMGADSCGQPPTLTGVYNMHSDHVGSVGFLTGDPASPHTGADGVLMRTMFTPFGEVAAQVGAVPVGWPTRGYTDHEHDSESDLVYMRARYYDPELGRFLSPDPALNNGGQSFARIHESPQAANVYAYVDNDPIGAVDPTGEGTHFVVKRSPLSQEAVANAVATFTTAVGRPPDAVWLVGSHSTGFGTTPSAATAASDIDIFFQTRVDGLFKDQGKGLEVFKALNPGRLPQSAQSINIGEIGKTIPKAGLVDVFFGPGTVLDFWKDISEPKVLWWGTGDARARAMTARHRLGFLRRTSAGRTRGLLGFKFLAAMATGGSALLVAESAYATVETVRGLNATVDPILDQGLNRLANSQGWRQFQVNAAPFAASSLDATFGTSLSAPWNIYSLNGSQTSGVPSYWGGQAGGQ